MDGEKYLNGRENLFQTIEFYSEAIHKLKNRNKYLVEKLRGSKIDVDGGTQTFLNFHIFHMFKSILKTHWIANFLNFYRSQSK
jgi:hypothetical protein